MVGYVHCYYLHIPDVEPIISYSCVAGSEVALLGIPRDGFKYQDALLPSPHLYHAH